MLGVSKRGRAAVVVAVVAAAALCSTATAANVLAVEPLPARSHWYFMRAVLRALATSGGHNVTAYTPFATSPTGGRQQDDCAGVVGCGYTELPLPLDIPHKVSLDVRTAVADFGDVWTFMGIAVNKSRSACDLIDRLTATGHFSRGVRYDLVVVELVSSQCTSRVSRALGVPLVYVFPSPMASWMEAKALGTRPVPSYAARLFARYAVPDTFAERLENVYGWVVTEALQWYHDGGDDDADYGTGYQKPAVTFVNSDPSVEKSVPAPGNMIHIGGIHLPPPESLPSVSSVCDDD